MPAAYSPDLRTRVLAAAREGRLSYGALAALFRVGESTIRGWVRCERETGRTTPKPLANGAVPAIAGAGEQVLRDLVDARNEATLAELAAGYRERTGQPVSVRSVWRACKRLDLRRKKRGAAARRAGAARRGGGAGDLAG
jgi:transposase